MLTKTLQIEILKFLGWKIFHILCPLHSGVGRIKDLELVEVGLGRPIYCLTGQAFISYGEHRTTRNTFILAVHHQDESNYVESELKLIRVQTKKLTLILLIVFWVRRVSRAGEMPAGGENFLDWSPQEAYCYHILPRNVGVISHIILDMQGAL